MIMIQRRARLEIVDEALLVERRGALFVGLCLLLSALDVLAVGRKVSVGEECLRAECRCGKCYKKWLASLKTNAEVRGNLGFRFS